MSANAHRKAQPKFPEGIAAIVQPRMLVAAALLLTAACHERRESPQRGSITVKLPPPRPKAPTPGFTFGKQPTTSFDSGPEP